ncbi:ACT domain-containing protein [Aeromicrobium sp. CF4.19]|uniref:ACT domain-containing protein n=1 Tax=Aeromicrobium sp. CF4.19 TaxID=3373082 RepID=UPI003EE477E1
MHAETDEPVGSDARSAEVAGVRLLEQPVVYAIVNPGYDASRALATVREDEGMTVVIGQEEADDDGLVYEFVGAWITLRQQTALEAVGITARLSSALAEADVPCNVVAGFHHDHLVVPWDRRHAAMQVLDGLG